MLDQKTAASWWVRLVVIVGALLMGTGAILSLVDPAMLVGRASQMNGAAQVFAGYFAVRNLAMALLLVVLAIMQAGRALGHVLALAGLIQLFDCALDCLEGRWTIAPGVLVLGMFFLFAASKLCGDPFWRRQAWLS
jgi:protein-S-isoprenylcysteine O-methyltransferase Ste14